MSLNSENVSLDPSFIQRRVRLKHAFVSILVALVLACFVRVVAMIIKAPGDGWESLHEVIPLGSSRDSLLDHDELQYYPLVEHLPLLDWEYETNGTERICLPPLDIPNYCCVGSGMFGFAPMFTHTACRNNPENLRLPFDQVQNRSLEYLRQHPLPFSPIRACDVCQIVHVLMAYNLSLAFEGDSVTRQTFAGLECQLRRRGYNVTKTFDEFIDKTRNWRSQWRSTTELIVLRGTESTTIRHFEFYRPDLVDMHKVLDRYHIDILVFDNGLHYLTTKRELWSFRQDSASLMQTFATKVRLLIWRETTTQHYFTTGGYYAKNLKQPCSPLNESKLTTTSVYMNAMVNVAKSMNWSYVYTDEPDFGHKPLRNDSRELVIIPFRQYTIPMHNLHPSAGDCSHYCSTPYLWLPLWRSLRLAIDRLVEQSRSASVL